MSTPYEIVAIKNDESHNQQAFFAWCNVAGRWGIENACNWTNGCDLSAPPDNPVIPGLLWAHHIPNGGLRNMQVAVKLKRDGVKKGVWDVFIPIPKSPYHGLYIEFKDPKRKPKTNRGKGGLSKEQTKFGDYVSGVGFCCCVAYSWKEAVQFVIDYLSYYG